MVRRLLRAVLIGGVSCSAPPQAVLPEPEPPLPSRAGYCERLQPLLDKTVQAARIGTEMACLDVPSVTELGRYGSASAGEEETLLNCFDETASYKGLLESPEAAFEIVIADAFQQDARAGLSLSALLPWLPRVEVGRARHLEAQVSIREARFVTLVGLASKLQGQTREQRCLEALCRPEYTYVHKALVGTPTVVISARNERGDAITVGPLWASAGPGLHFSEREVASGGRELRSDKPVTLAIARSTFRTAQTERLCRFCGKRGQACCSEGPSCDGGMGCVATRCVEVGSPGQPCDGDSCAAGATCVRGECRVECGGKGQPCCVGSACSGQLHCAPNPENSLEHLVFTRDVPLEGGFFGTNEDQTFGSSTCGALRRRARFAVTKLGSGRGDCAKAWWFEPKNEKDCRVGVHFDVGTFGSLTCRVEVFATDPPKPDLCLH